MIYYWKDLKTKEITDVQQGIAILPVGSLEQHANHLPLGTDVYLGDAIAAQAAKISEKACYLLPSVTYGFSAHHMDFSGSVTLRQKTLEMLVEDIAESAIASGFINFVFLISHGGNSAAVQFAVNELGSRHRNCKFTMMRYWDFMKEFVSEIRQTELGGMGHAGELETSVMQYLYPDLVGNEWGDYKLARGNAWYHPDMFAANRITTYMNFQDISPYGNVGTCEYASREKGKLLFDYVTKKISKFLDGYFDKTEEVGKCV